MNDEDNQRSNRVSLYLDVNDTGIKVVEDTTSLVESFKLEEMQPITDSIQNDKISVSAEAVCKNSNKSLGSFLETEFKSNLNVDNNTSKFAYSDNWFNRGIVPRYYQITFKNDYRRLKRQCLVCLIALLSALIFLKLII